MSKVTKIIIGSVLFLIFALYFYFKGRRSKTDQPLSNDNEVSEAISFLDSRFDRWGTFNSDHVGIFPLLQKLSKTQIIKLHNDFGFRFYNSVFGKYKLVDTWGWRGFTTKVNLTSLFDKEFGDSQILKLKEIYRSKGLSFPLVS